MVQRVLLDQNGLRVSRPGVEVASASRYDLLFSSDFKAPVLVKKGTFNSPSSQGTAAEQVTRINYDRTINPPPFVAAIANSSNWANNTINAGNSQYDYLDNRWHTFILEWPSVARTNLYEGKNIKRGPLVTGVDPVGTIQVPATWASAKFIARITTTYVEFATLCFQTVTVKYAILEA